MNGSLFGRGPGEGTVKAQLPDAHTDFVMAVAGEEFGLVVCLMILALFAFVTLRVAVARLEGDQPVHHAGGDRARRAVRPAGRDQHGLDHPAHSRQGHDPAVHLLRRLVGAGDGDLRRHDAVADARACRPAGGGVMAEPRPQSSSRPAAPAGTCSRPRRWPASSRRAACRSPWSPIRAAGSGRARCRAGRSTTSIRPAPPARCGRRLMAMLSLGLGLFDAWRALGRIGPSAVVGFGGYASVPTMIAARLRRAAGHAARAERRAGQGQPPGAGRRGADRDLVRPHPLRRRRPRARLVGNPVREPVRAAARLALSRAGRGPRDRPRWCSAAARARPRSARSCPRRSCRCRRPMRARLRLVAAVPARGPRAGAPALCRRPASWPSWRRSSPTCRSGWPARIW